MSIVVELAEISPFTHGSLLLACYLHMPLVYLLQSAPCGCCGVTCAATVSQACVRQYPAIGIVEATAGRQITPHVFASNW
jgi:hypothetical protein